MTDGAVRMSESVVLVVDDDEDAHAFLRVALADAGFESAHVRDGVAATAWFAQHHADLVLLDAVMPGPDGFKTCRLLKADARSREAPVIFMTALADKAHVVEGLSAGGVDYLVKPVIVAELIARINVHLATARRARVTQGALAATGAALFGLAPDRSVAWSTPAARIRLDEALGDDGTVMEGETSLVPGQAYPMPLAAGSTAAWSIERLAGPDGVDAVYRIERAAGRPPGEILRDAFDLSTRESQVLTWVAEGKANRDVSAILGISPRTVDKHLEQIFRKMGVENRTAATARALVKLGQSQER